MAPTVKTGGSLGASAAPASVPRRAQRANARISFFIFLPPLLPIAWQARSTGSNGSAKDPQGDDERGRERLRCAKAGDIPAATHCRGMIFPSIRPSGIAFPALHV